MGSAASGTGLAESVAFTRFTSWPMLALRSADSIGDGALDGSGSLMGPELPPAVVAFADRVCSAAEGGTAALSEGGGGVPVAGGAITLTGWLAVGFEMPATMLLEERVREARCARGTVPLSDGGVASADGVVSWSSALCALSSASAFIEPNIPLSVATSVLVSPPSRTMRCTSDSRRSRRAFMAGVSLEVRQTSFSQASTRAASALTEPMKRCTSPSAWSKRMAKVRTSCAQGSLAADSWHLCSKTCTATCIRRSSLRTSATACDRPLSTTGCTTTGACGC
mmetsp:Transcript_76634/g.203508  ORF Transcript_76634/g.203508 Transcript_76634/m.203508 type:complete len:281 (+) Transcript_76634:698-1540(+)